MCLLSNYNAVDTASAVAIALMTFGTMYPMSVYSGKVLLQVRPARLSLPILFSTSHIVTLLETVINFIAFVISHLQTTPSHIIGQLDKLLREVRGSSHQQ